MLGCCVGCKGGFRDGIKDGVTVGLDVGFNGQASALYITPPSIVASLIPSTTFSLTTSLSPTVIGGSILSGVRLMNVVIRAHFDPGLSTVQSNMNNMKT